MGRGPGRTGEQHRERAMRVGFWEKKGGCDLIKKF